MLQPDNAVAQFYLDYGCLKVHRLDEARAALGKAAAIGQGPVREDANALLRQIQ